MTMRNLYVPLGLVALSLTVACPDPQARFEEFESRVVDASPLDLIDAPPLEELPDITGEFYVTFDPIPVAPMLYFQFIWTATLTQNADGTGNVVVNSLALDTNTRQIAKNADGSTPEPIVLTSPVNKAGEFRLEFRRAIIPASANPIGNLVDLDLNGATTIKTADMFCGVAVEGSKMYAPINGQTLVGSLFTAVRVPPGTRGEDLPQPSSECNVPEPMIDAGVLDAGVLDAGVLDAGIDAAPPVDATPIDASNP